MQVIAKVHMTPELSNEQSNTVKTIETQKWSLQKQFKRNI